MRSSRWFLVAALLVVARCAVAQDDALPLQPPQQARPLIPAASAAPAVAPAAPRPGMFAAASAASVKRLTPEQRDEWRFLKDAAAASRFESEASRVALAKSNHAGVRSFATGLLDHHATAGITLQQMLHVRNMAAPMLTNEQRKVLNRLGKLNGNKFDREYLDDVALRSGQENIAAFERASAVVRDPALKAWIDRTLPTLRYQLSTADRVSSGNTRLAKAGTAVAATKPPARQAVLPVAAATKVPAAHLATRLMGSGAPPPPTSQLGEPGAVNMQLGPVQPLAVRTSDVGSR